MKVMIDSILKEKGWTRYKLAKEVGVTYITIVNICEGKSTSIKFDIMEKICKVLGVTLDKVFVVDLDINED